MQVEEIAIETLVPWDGNPRRNDHAVGAVARSIEKFGFNVPIVCDQDLNIVAGHTRLRAAEKLGLARVPVLRVHLDDAQRKAFAIADNKTTEIADWDFPKLSNILSELRSEEFELESLGFGDEELRRLLVGAGKDENEVPNDAVEPSTEPGDLWILGDHRLLCGDSREPESYARLMGRDPAAGVFGGPPYFNQREYSHWDEYEDYLNDMRAVVGNCADRLVDGGVLAWNIGNGSSTYHDHTGHHSRLLEEADLRFLHNIAWVKPAGNLSVLRNLHIRRNRLYYPTFQWESLLIYQQPGDMPRMSEDGAEYMSEFQTDVWQVPVVPQQKRTVGHPAVCPVEIPYRYIHAYTTPGDVVLEPFGGSGTTLIAAEKAARKARLIERNPEYCDVIIRRWKNFTERKAKRV